MEKRERLAKQFIKERGLSRTFSVYRRIHGRKKVSVTHIFSNYDGTSRRETIILTRNKGVVTVYDKPSLSVIGRMKGSIKDALKAIDKTRKDDSKISFKNWNVTNKKKIRSLDLKNVRTVESYNKALNRTRTIKMTNRRVDKFGFAVVDATYTAADGTRKRVQARSRGGFNLADKQQRAAALENALHNGSVIAEFTPVEVVINDYWFEVWTDKYN